VRVATGPDAWFAVSARRVRSDGGWRSPTSIRAMFATIVVGVDARPGGRDALALAAQLSETLGGRLLAVHAYPYDYFISRDADPAFEAAMHGAAQETLDTELERMGVTARAIATPDDSPARALHRIPDRKAPTSSSSAPPTRRWPARLRPPRWPSCWRSCAAGCATIGGRR